MIDGIGISDMGEESLVNEPPCPRMSSELSRQDADQKLAKDLADQLRIEFQRKGTRGWVPIPGEVTIRVVRLAMYHFRASNEGFKCIAEPDVACDGLAIRFVER